MIRRAFAPPSPSIIAGGRRCATPDDDLVLETAINGGAAVVASFNVADMQAGRPAVRHRHGAARGSGKEDQRMSSFPLRLPDDLKERMALQAEAERSFAARAARATPGQARDILARAGRSNPPRSDDELVEKDSRQ
jgi:hypothetical protein